MLCWLGAQAQGDRFVCDESCDPGIGGVAKFNVVSPVGFSTVEPIEMAPRLTTFDGMTIAIMGYPALNDMLLTSTPGGNEGGSAAIRSARSQTNAGRPVRSEYYNMQGQRNPYRRGAYIRRDTYGNGSSQSRKRIGR
jgi:hypothetical protein